MPKHSLLIVPGINLAELRRYTTHYLYAKAAESPEWFDSYPQTNVSLIIGHMSRFRRFGTCRKDTWSSCAEAKRAEGLHAGFKFCAPGVGNSVQPCCFLTPLVHL